MLGNDNNNGSSHVNGKFNTIGGQKYEFMDKLERRIMKYKSSDRFAKMSHNNNNNNNRSD